MQDKPRRQLVLGVTGHRPNRLPEHARGFVEQQLAELFAGVARAADGIAVTLVSALAEGADMMAARAALAAGSRLDAVLPFPAREYKKDFSVEGARAFDGFCTKAALVLELGGTRTDEEKAYEDVGLAVLDRSDMLVAIWDGGASAGRGGTTEIVAEAARRAMPIIRIDAKGETPTTLSGAPLTDGMVLEIVRTLAQNRA